MLLLLATYGVCFGLMNDKVPVVWRLRESWPFLNRMLSCSYCTGFHAGWAVQVVAWGVQGWPPSLMEGVVVGVGHGFAGAAFCYLAESVARWVDTQAGG